MVRTNLRLTAFYLAVISWAVFCFATITKRSCCVGRSRALFWQRGRGACGNLASSANSNSFSLQDSSTTKSGMLWFGITRNVAQPDGVAY